MRTKIDLVAFRDFLPEGAYMYKTTELPKFKYKKNGVEYGFTDVSLLHPGGAYIIQTIINEAANNGMIKDVTFNAGATTDEDINKVIDIVLGFEMSAKKKRSWEYSSKLVSSAKTAELNGERYIVFELGDSVSKSIADAAKEKNEITMTDIIDKLVEEINRRAKE